MTTPTRSKSDLTLARDGGTPARTRPEPPMFPGGMEVATTGARSQPASRHARALWPDSRSRSGLIGPGRE